MHPEGVTMRVSTCAREPQAIILPTCRPWSIEFGDALGGSDGASLEMHLKAEIE